MAKRILNSKAMEVCQDLVVLAKSAVAAIAAILIMGRQLPQNLKCNKKYYYFCVGTATSAKLWNLPYEKLSNKTGCQPTNNLGGFYFSFIVLVILNILLFLTAIVLKHSGYSLKHPSFKAFMMCAFSFLLAFSKLGLVIYSATLVTTRFKCPFYESYFSNNCDTITASFSDVVSHCIEPIEGPSLQKCPGQTPNNIKISRCTDTYDCSQLYEGHVPNTASSELIVLSCTFFLTFLYILYLTYEYYEQQKGRVSAQLQQSGYGALTGNNQSVSVMSECASATTSDTMVDNSTNEQNVQYKHGNERVGIKLLRDLSAFTKYLIVFATLVLSTLDLSVSPIVCEMKDKSLENICSVNTPCEPLQSACMALLPSQQVKTVLYIFVYSGILLICSFIATIIIEKKHLFVKRAAKVALSLAFVVSISFLAQFLTIVYSPYLSVFFDCAEEGYNKGNYTTVGTRGVCASKDIDPNVSFGIEGKHMSCHNLCFVKSSYLTWILTITILLTYFYIMFLVCCYYTKAKEKCQEKKAN